MAVNPIKVWNGTAWEYTGPVVAAPPVKYQATQPSSPATGDVWVESDVDVATFDPSQIVRGGAYTDEAARSSAITSPVTGMITYVGDTGTDSPASTIPQIQAYNGSAWQNTDGLTLLANVTASAAASVSIDNVFSSTYDHYRLIWTQDATLANGAAYIKYRNGSGDVSTAKYAYQRIYAFGTTIGADSVADNTIGFLGSLDGSGPTNVKRFLVADIHNPFISTSSTSATVYAATGQTVINLTHSNYNQADSFTGLKLSMQSSNTTGNIRIYGYRNA